MMGVWPQLAVGAAVLGAGGILPQTRWLVIASSLSGLFSQPSDTHLVRVCPPFFLWPAAFRLTPFSSLAPYLFLFLLTHLFPTLFPSFSSFPSFAFWLLSPACILACLLLTHHLFSLHPPSLIIFVLGPRVQPPYLFL